MHIVYDKTLVDYLKESMSLARKSDYLYVVCLISREADCPKIYEHIEKSWSSYHSLSGGNILILTAGKKNREYKNGLNIHEGGKTIVHESVQVISSSDNVTKEEIYAYLPERHDFKNTHTLEVNDLLDYLNIEDDHEPRCLIMDTFNNTKNFIKLDKENELSFYDLLKKLKKESDIINEKVTALLKDSGIPYKSIELSRVDLEGVYSRKKSVECLNSIIEIYSNSPDSDEICSILLKYTDLLPGEVPKLDKEKSLDKLKILLKSKKRFKVVSKAISNLYDLPMMEKSEQDIYDQGLIVKDTEIVNKVKETYSLELKESLQRLNKDLFKGELIKFGDDIEGKYFGINFKSILVRIKNLYKKMK